jgi:hypothetical protein
VVVHQAIGMAKPVITMACFRKDVKERLSVFVITVYTLSSIASRSYVIYCAGIFYPKWPGHAKTIAALIPYVKKIDLTPIRPHKTVQPQFIFGLIDELPVDVLCLICNLRSFCSL